MFNETPSNQYSGKYGIFAIISHAVTFSLKNLWLLRIPTSHAITFSLKYLWSLLVPTAYMITFSLKYLWSLTLHRDMAINEQKINSATASLAYSTVLTTNYSNAPTATASTPFAHTTAQLQQAQAEIQRLKAEIQKSQAAPAAKPTAQELAQQHQQAMLDRQGQSTQTAYAQWVQVQQAQLARAQRYNQNQQVGTPQSQQAKIEIHNLDAKFQKLAAQKATFSLSPLLLYQEEKELEAAIASAQDAGILSSDTSAHELTIGLLEQAREQQQQNGGSAMVFSKQQMDTLLQNQRSSQAHAAAMQQQQLAGVQSVLYYTQTPQQ